MTYVFTIKDEGIAQIVDFYNDYQVNPTSPYIKYMFKNDDIVVSIFTSNKVTLQGNAAQEDYLMWSEILGFEAQTSLEKETTTKTNQATLQFLSESTIGSDEVGTGDFFGPVVVVACYVRKEFIQKLRDAGVDDSKKLNDEAIMRIVPQIEPFVLYQLLVVDNPKYNDLVRNGFNLNKIKAYLHNHAILKLKSRIHENVDRVILDEFCSKKNYFDYLSGRDYYSDITFLQKAESQSIAVAAASIIARYNFLKEMDKLSTKMGFVLPKGAGEIVDLLGKRIALEHGFAIFEEIAKIHFKNFEKIKQMTK
ncbi:MAG: ribonuclease HIII [Candidatus Izemoplasmatales bacterium]